MSIEDDKLEYQKRFYSIYHNEILPFFQKFEKERKKRLLKFCMYIIILSVLLIGASFVYFSNPEGLWQELIGGIIGVPSIFLLIIIPLYMKDSIIFDIKSMCMKKLISAFENITWTGANSQITDVEMKKSGLFKNVDGHTTDDSLIGKYKDVSFKVDELYTYGDSSKASFKGVILVFKSNKIIRNNTIIENKGDMLIKNLFLPYLLQCVFVILLCVVAFCCLIAAFIVSDVISKIIFPIFGAGLINLAVILIKECIDKHKKNSDVVIDKNMKEIKLEDVIFAKKYRAYSSDQIEGRYLITPAFMERFQNIQTAFGSNKTKCAFYDDKIMFAISTRKNLFEIGGLFQSLENPKHLQDFFNEIISIYLMIDYFKLDEKTGL